HLATGPAHHVRFGEHRAQEHPLHLGDFHVARPLRQVSTRPRSFCQSYEGKQAALYSNHDRRGDGAFTTSAESEGTSPYPPRALRAVATTVLFRSRSSAWRDQRRETLPI